MGFLSSGRRMPKKVGSQLRSVTQKRNQGRFSVTHGYVNTQRRCVTDRFHDYADPCFWVLSDSHGVANPTLTPTLSGLDIAKELNKEWL